MSVIEDKEVEFEHLLKKAEPVMNPEVKDLIVNLNERLKILTNVLEILTDSKRK